MNQDASEPEAETPELANADPDQAAGDRRPARPERQVRIRLRVGEGEVAPDRGGVREAQVRVYRRGIDQDPHFRITRDIAESLGYPKPALIHSKMLPGLLGDRVMSTSGEQKDNALFLNDPPKEVQRKVRNAFTGGRATTGSLFR